MRAKALALVVTALIASSGFRVAAATPVVLGGTNVITGSRAGSILVRVPAPATVDPWTDEGVSITGAGRFAGIAMGDAQRGSQGNMLHALNFHYCTTPGCSTEVSGRIGSVYSAADRTLRNTLAAGDYVLHLIADAAPISVTLRLGGLTGTTSIRPSGPSDLDIRPLEEKLTVGQKPTQPVYTAAGSGSFASRGGLIASNFWFIGRPHVASNFGDCLYEGKPPRYYLPHCPTATISFSWLDLWPAMGHGWAMYGVTTVPNGEWTVQTWYLAAAQVEEVHSTGLWLSL